MQTSLNGKMKKKRNSIFIVVAIISSTSLAQDYLPAVDLEKDKHFQEVKVDAAYSSSDEASLPDQIYPNSKANSQYLFDSEGKIPDVISSSTSKHDYENYNLPDSKQDEILNDKKYELPIGKVSGIRGVGVSETPENYSQADNRAHLKKISSSGKSAFRFSYFPVNNITFKDQAGIFDRVYKNGSGNRKSGMLLLSNEKFFSRKAIEWSVILTAGFSYYSGLGRFSDGTTSETRFSLWMIPLDLGLGIGIPASRFFKIKLSGGPSILFLSQNRNDRSYGENGKTRRQIGTGYFAEGKAQFSLGNMFSKLGFQLFSEYKASQFFFNLEARLQSYARFQDDISIDSQSFGAGFQFEFL